MFSLVLNSLPNSRINEETYSKAEFTTQKWHHLTRTKISETSGTSKLLEYVHDIPEM